MNTAANTLSFDQLHIDIGRNASDDFNPFHDPQRWRNVRRNPFSGPIVLGFQLECLIAACVERYRDSNAETALIAELGLRYSCYEFRFVSAVLPGQRLRIEVQPGQVKEGASGQLSNRVRLFCNDQLAVTGYKRESRAPLYLQELHNTAPANLAIAQDRDYLPDSAWFLKRKYLTTSNAKNFLCASLVEQTRYIDEIAEKVDFPEMFPCALISNALLERAWRDGHDFEAQPMIYLAHRLCCDRVAVAGMRSNTALHILTRPSSDAAGLTQFDALGVLGADQTLFQGRIDLQAL
jgi:acyl dehydratase